MTDGHRIHGSIAGFFDRELVPVAEDLSARKIRFFPTGADRSATSYWMRRSRTRMRREDFVSTGCRRPEDLQRALERIWVSFDSKPLLTLAEGLTRIARELHRADRNERADVSPFVYVMY